MKPLTRIKKIKLCDTIIRSVVYCCMVAEKSWKWKVKSKNINSPSLSINLQHIFEPFFYIGNAETEIYGLAYQPTRGEIVKTKRLQWASYVIRMGLRQSTWNRKKLTVWWGVYKQQGNGREQIPIAVWNRHVQEKPTKWMNGEYIHLLPNYTYCNCTM